MANWYDHPEYFDAIFSDETELEVKFFQEVFAEFADRKVKDVLEPGCGSGRLVIAMAKLGFNVTALDLSEPMLDYLHRQMKRRRVDATVIHGDMTDMRFSKKFDAAFCTFNTFRHLLTESQALAHLRCVGNALRKGGIYILGFHVIPLDADPESTERFTAKSGSTTVSLTLKVVDTQRRKRKETLRALVKATKRDGSVDRIRSDFDLRLYTHRQVKSMLAKVEDLFEIAEIFDFDYDIETPRDLDADLTDAIFILRKT